MQVRFRVYKIKDLEFSKSYKNIPTQDIDLPVNCEVIQ